LNFVDLCQRSNISQHHFSGPRGGVAAWATLKISVMMMMMMILEQMYTVISNN